MEPELSVLAEQGPQPSRCNGCFWNSFRVLVRAQLTWALGSVPTRCTFSDSAAPVQWSLAAFLNSTLGTAQLKSQQRLSVFASLLGHSIPGPSGKQGTGDMQAELGGELHMQPPVHCKHCSKALPLQQQGEWPAAETQEYSAAMLLLRHAQ